MRHRKLDWIQFGILICALVSIFAEGYIGRGRLMQQVDDQQRTIEELKQSVKDLDTKLENKSQLLTQQIQELAIKRNLSSQ